MIMKNVILHFKYALPFLASSLLFFSCVDKDIDLENASDNMAIGNTLAAPVGEADFNIEKLLANFKADDASFSIGSENSVITLYYKDTIEYVNPTDLSIDDADCFSKIISGADLVDPNLAPLAFPLNISSNRTLNADKEFHISKISDDNESTIDSIYFYYSNVKLNLKTNIALNGGMIQINFRLRNATTGVFDKELMVTTNDVNKEMYIENFEISTTEKDSIYPIKMDIALIPASASQPIVINSTDTIGISFQPMDITEVNGVAKSKFVAFGTFNYTKIYQEDAPKNFSDLKLYDFLPPGCLIKPVDPSITLKISSNIGIPLNFNIESLRTSDGIINKEATFSNGNQFKINRAENNGEETISTIVFNKDADKGNIDDLFSIKLNSALLDINFTQDLASTSTKKQFIRSDSKVKADVDIALPIWLESNSILAYSDTLDLDMGDLLNSDAITDAVIKLSNTNRLPLGLEIKFSLMDENYAIIPTANQYIYTVDPANIDVDGNVVSEVKSAFDIKYNNASIVDLRKAKYILLGVTCKGFNDGASRMKIKNQDGLKIKVGVYTNTGYKL